MKTGILTFQATSNYGANLQAFALQKTIEAMGVPCEIIDYRCEAVAEREKVRKLSDSKSAKDVVKWATAFLSSRKRARLFSRFQDLYLKLSERSYDAADIWEANRSYDLFIAGSDQIWNLTLSGGDFTFFLDFVTDDSKKASYAGSFGYRVIPEQYRQKCRRYLEKFRYLSVRETQAAQMIGELLGKGDAQVVLDPIFLVDRRTWDQFCDPPPVKGDYILLYFLHDEDPAFRFARNLAKKNRFKIVYLHSNPLIHPFITNLRAVSPNSFLSLIKNARYVVTGSFHGAAFSIYFHKRFYIEPPGKGNEYSSRLESLLNLFHLEGRRISDGDGDADVPIDYGSVDRKLESERQKSIHFLETVMKGRMDE